MAVEQVARWPWNAWPDESGLGGRMAWNPQIFFNGLRKFITEKNSASTGTLSAKNGLFGNDFGWIQRRIGHSNCR